MEKYCFAGLVSGLIVSIALCISYNFFIRTREPKAGDFDNWKNISVKKENQIIRFKSFSNQIDVYLDENDLLTNVRLRLFVYPEKSKAFVDSGSFSFEIKDDSLLCKIDRNSK